MSSTKERPSVSLRGSELLERAAALRRLSGALASARSGTGAFVLIEGHAGVGKTRLLDAATERAADSGMVVLRVSCAELERNLSFGVAERLVKSLLVELPARRRSLVLRKAPQLVRPLLAVGSAARAAGEDSASHEPPPSAGDAATLALAHALFTVSAEALEGAPALVTVDDLHWCDQASLEFLLYLANRLGELPIAITGARRTGVGEHALDVLERIAAVPHVRLEQLAPLSLAAVGTVVERVLGERAGPRRDRGLRPHHRRQPVLSPRALLQALDDDPALNSSELAERARTLAPDAVIRAVRTRVGRRGHRRPALAGAAAMLGDDAPAATGREARGAHARSRPRRRPTR